MTVSEHPQERKAWSDKAGDSGSSSRYELPETDTIAQAKQGDGAAFERIYRRYSRRIYALCLRMVGNAAEAEDLMQEAFVRVFRNIHTFRGESAFSTWVHRLTLNVVLMKLRKKKLPEAALERVQTSYEKRSMAGNEVASQDLSLTGLVDRVHLQRAVSQLPPACKMVLVLHDVQGYKHFEIAEMMDSSVGTSKGRLHRARKQLRELLCGSRHGADNAAEHSGHGEHCPAGC